MAKAKSLPFRTTAFASLTVVPFWHFLIQNQFSVYRSEALAIAALFLGSAVLLAAATRGRWFNPILGVCVIVVATFPVRTYASSFADLSPWIAGGVLAVLLSVIALLVRDSFPMVVVIFSVSFLAADILRLPVVEVGAIGPAPKVPLAHTLYLVLDGHIGIAGFPNDIPACVAARQEVLSALQGNAFAIYPNAFSNYAATLQSIPSILNRRLVRTLDEFSSGRTPGGAVIIAPNRLFEEYQRKNFQVVVYQHRSIDYSAGLDSVDRTVSYASVLNGIDDVSGWWRRALWIAGSYQGTDPLVSQARAFLPFRLAYRQTGPLAIQAVWPNRLLSDITTTTQPALFFVHLLSPHEPYVYKEDGSVKNYEEWAFHGSNPMPGDDYRFYYGRYCDQVRALAGQLNTFLAGLRANGVLDSMTIVIHGDHGSRIRMQASGGTVNAAQRDITNQYSALLAIRKPGSTESMSIPDKRSVLSCLLSDFYEDRATQPPGLDGAYWFDGTGSPREIPSISYGGN